MEPSFVASLRQKLIQTDDLSDRWLRRAHCPLGLACFIYGLITIAFGFYYKDTVLIALGVSGFTCVILLFCCLVCFKVFYTLWFLLATLLLLIGGALMQFQKEASYFFLALGGFFMVLLVSASLLLRCDVWAPRNAEPPVQNEAIEYHPPAEGVEERVEGVGEGVEEGVREGVEERVEGVAE